jgi:hypothetical protein
VWLFANQAKYVGPVPEAHPGVGDLAPVVGFVLAAVLYLVLYRPLAAPTPPVPAEIPVSA